MGAMAYKITSLTIVYSIVYSDVDQRKHQSSASLAFVWGIHRRPVNSPQKGPVTRKMFPFDDVIMANQFLCHVINWNTIIFFIFEVLFCELLKHQYISWAKWYLCYAKFGMCHALNTTEKMEPAERHVWVKYILPHPWYPGNLIGPMIWQLISHFRAFPGHQKSWIGAFYQPDPFYPVGTRSDVVMLTSWHGKPFSINGILWWEYTGHQWVPFRYM